MLAKLELWTKLLNLLLMIIVRLSQSSGLPRSGKNIWKMKFFPGQGKVREFLNDQGNLERTWKVREK